LVNFAANTTLTYIELLFSETSECTPVPYVKLLQNSVYVEFPLKSTTTTEIVQVQQNT
jgi:hypothetical protein